MLILQLQEISNLRLIRLLTQTSRAISQLCLKAKQVYILLGYGFVWYTLLPMHKKVVHDYEVQTILQLIKNSLQEMLGRTLYFYSVYQYTLKVSIQRWYFFRISHPQGTPVYPYPPSLEVFSMRPCLSTFTCVLISFLDLICDGPFFWWLETKTRFILQMKCSFGYLLYLRISYITISVQFNISGAAAHIYLVAYQKIFPKTPKLQQKMDITIKEICVFNYTYNFVIKTVDQKSIMQQQQYQTLFLSRKNVDFC
eukprot:TRINITY_DN3471_c0_g1_i7.p2 TRINITY_DN3471_c0_g1~~TRINITY_DN3471_c0_g1_i7.p2  ORF type:complete len:254 (-),score=-8.33 TRINITY_DN3471_c0_g1_i7:272-1033(-)